MIEIKNASFKYKEEAKESIKGINLTIKKGEVVLLCGESGCGKSTLTRVINGLIPQFFTGDFTGQVLIDGQSINDAPLYETAKKVGSVFQNPRTQFFTVNTTSELAFGCENQGMPEQEILKRIDRITGDMKLESLLNRNIFGLSGGEKQKIACGSIAVSNPDIMVLDEPSSNLDFEAIEDLKRSLLMWKQQGKTIIIAEHRLYFLMEMADRILYMKNGVLEHEFAPEQLRKLKKEELEDMGLRVIDLTHLYGTKIQKSEQLKPEFRNEWNIRNLEYGYEYRKEVLHIQELDLPKNEVIAVIGHNGAGKSTFAKCICNLVKKNKCYLLNKEGKKEKIHSHCYMVMQDVNHQLFTESVEEELKFNMKGKQETAMDEVLSSLDLSDLKERHPMSLSGGQKQRVAIANAIISGRELLILDEPTSGLDFKHMMQVAENIKKLQQRNISILIITHDLEFILSCCTYVLQLECGKVENMYPLVRDKIERIIKFWGNKYE